MANRMKEEEKNERIIRGLLKLTPNRRCINCNSLGPQYVCTNFWTFICTNCSGLHREFTHRVKSVSMAKFTSQEVSALQAGGNERAKEIYLKEWDSARQSLPDSSNPLKVRDFIKHVYVDKRYTGERSTDKPPRAKSGDKEDSYQNRRVDPYRSGSRSPPSENSYDHHGERSGHAGQNDDRNSRYSYEERRSPGYGQDTRYGDSKRSPGRVEVVDDWRREDRFGNGRRSEDRRSSDGESRSEGRSPNSQTDLGISSPPVVRPVRDILGEDAPPLRIGEPPKANGGKVADVPPPLRIGEPPKANGSKVADVPPHTQRTASSSSLGSIDATLGSLIDFDADPEPAIAPPSQPTKTPSIQSIAPPATNPSTDTGNWASFDFAAQTSVPNPGPAPAPAPFPSNVNNLDSVLSELSFPAVAPPSNVSAFPTTGSAPTASPLDNAFKLSTGSSGGASVVAPGGQWPNMQQNFTPSVGGTPNNQMWGSVSQVSQGSLPTSSQPSSIPTQEVSRGMASQPNSLEAKPSGREALPEDLFAATYSLYPAQNTGWHAGLSHGMGFGMQYPTAVQMPAYPQTSRASNPFDMNHEQPTIVHASSFPNMASLQGALPNVAASPGLPRASSVGSWMPQQAQPYASAMQTPPSYGGGVPQGAFMGQQLPPNGTPAVGHQGIGGFGGEGSFFGGLNMDQQLDSRYSQPPAQTSFTSHGGNPFG
ncbi:hypothetical protein MKW94_023684 [Papaver nudicaule]|uniref:Arf-GAP domain-containing protein n=1 Tax=Papaver nudicaule TaxID=74823 RepID=A0AA41W0S1_PAPNU|nr:hypothetical protein [Papaver nudicaule]